MVVRSCIARVDAAIAARDEEAALKAHMALVTAEVRLRVMEAVAASAGGACHD